MSKKFLKLILLIVLITNIERIHSRCITTSSIYHLDSSTPILTSTQMIPSTTISTITLETSNIIIQEPTHQILGSTKPLTKSTNFVISSSIIPPIITTTQQPYRFVKCNLGLKKSILFGTSFSDSTSFSITTSQIKGLTIFYTSSHLNSIQFNLINGQVLVFGNTNEMNVKKTDIDYQFNFIT